MLRSRKLRSKGSLG